MSGKTNWADLLPRTLSAIVMAIVGVAAVYFGGAIFTLLILASLVAMLWELSRMASPALKEGRDWPIFLAYALAIIAASLNFIYLRSLPVGLWSILALFMIVILTDIFGYFAGRLLGGPKFWPRISPKKTWSGTIAGWVAAGLFGYNALALGFPLELLVIAKSPLVTAFIFMCLAFASQMGDIVESAMKRRYGIKDSSNLIPGHGGVLDRFDGMVGVGAVAALYFFLFAGFGS